MTRKKYSVAEKAKKYRADVKVPKKKGNTFRKGYVTALNDVNREYKVTKR